MSEEPKEQTLGGMLDRLPAWAQVGLVLYNLAGLPTCILVYNALENAGVIPNVVQAELVKVNTNLEKIQDGMQQDAGHAIRHDATMQEMVRHLDESSKREQMRCVLRAKTDDEKKSCFPTAVK